MKVPSFGEQIKILDDGCFFQGQVNACVWGPTQFFTPPGLNSGCFYWDWTNASEWCSAWEGSWFHVYPGKNIGVSAEHASAGTRVLSASTRVPEQLSLHVSCFTEASRKFSGTFSVGSSHSWRDFHCSIQLGDGRRFQGFKRLKVPESLGVLCYVFWLRA